MKIGDTVYHRAFGYGTIVAIRNVFYLIKFEMFPGPRVIGKSYFDKKQEEDKDEGSGQTGKETLLCTKT